MLTRKRKKQVVSKIGGVNLMQENLGTDGLVRAVFNMTYRGTGSA